jgi:uncharacterized membrane protein
MTARVRYGVLALAALGLGASSYALYVHYQLLTDPGYASLCDLNETVSCAQVFQSQYGSIAGVPVAAGGAIWSALVLLLAVWAGYERPTRGSRAAGYILVLAVLGLGAVAYLGYASFAVLGQACPVCMTMYVSVIGTFLLSAGAAISPAALWSGLGEDVRGLRRSVTAVGLAALWVLASLGLVLGFPRERVPSVEEASGAAPAAQPTETLTATQLAEIHAWVDAQPRRSEVMAGEGRVRLIKFNDYQCPTCRQAWLLYQSIIGRYETQYPGVFQYESRDYPLEPECGPVFGHTAACEAAVAVRLASEQDRRVEMESTLFSRQSATMTRADIATWLEEVAGVSGADYDARYDAVLDEVREDVRFAQSLGVTGTPTFFVNGLELPDTLMRPAAFEAIIAYEVQKAGILD